MLLIDSSGLAYTTFLSNTPYSDTIPFLPGYELLIANLVALVITIKDVLRGYTFNIETLFHFHFIVRILIATS
jgi:hypothetical protein